MTYLDRLSLEYSPGGGFHLAQLLTLTAFTTCEQGERHIAPGTCPRWHGGRSLAREYGKQR